MASLTATRRGAAGHITASDRSLRRQALPQIGTETRIDGAQLVIGEPRQLHAAANGRRNDTPRDLVSLAKRHAALDEIVGNLGCGGVARRRHLRHPRAIEAQRGEGLAHDLQAGQHQVLHAKQGLLVLLQVQAVGQRARP